MSDYFGYLAQLTLGVTPSLKPRPASRFDPAATMETMPAMVVVDEAAEPPQRSPRPAAPTRTEPPSELRHGRHATRLEPKRRPQDEAAPGSAEGDLEGGPAIPTSRPPVPQTSPDSVVAESAQARAAEEPPIAATQPAPHTHVERVVREPSVPPAERPLVSPQVRWIDESAPQHPTDSGGDAGSERVVVVHAERPVARDGSRQDLDACTTAPSSDPPPSGAPPGFVVDSDRERAARLGRRIPPSPPTIQVTIGRVEVRAVQPPPSVPPQPTSRAPELTLDDYLKSRSGG
jgi:hypothetical protein